MQLSASLAPFKARQEGLIALLRSSKINQCPLTDAIHNKV